jgi:hypothetical protein
MYFEDLKNRSGIPTLTYSVSVEKILLETTPWLTKVEVVAKAGSFAIPRVSPAMSSSD